MLVAFDFDGTLSDSEMIELLGEEAGVRAEIEAVTERAMNGEMDFATSLRRRAALLEGLSVNAADRAYDRVRLRPGAADVLDRLRDAGVATAILTGGFEAGVRSALERDDTDVDRIVANRLPAVDGRLTGDVEGPLIEATKDDVLQSVVSELSIPMAATVAIGDGANDLPMLATAGTAIGYQPKRIVAPHCDHVVGDMPALAATFESLEIL